MRRFLFALILAFTLAGPAWPRDSPAGKWAKEGAAGTAGKVPAKPAAG